MPPVQLRPGINISLTTTDPFLLIIAWTCNRGGGDHWAITELGFGHAIIKTWELGVYGFVRIFLVINAAPPPLDQKMHESESAGFLVRALTMVQN